MSLKELPRGYKRIKVLDLSKDKLGMLFSTVLSFLIILIMLALGLFIPDREYIGKYILVETTKELLDTGAILLLTAFTLLINMLVRETIHISLIKHFCKGCKTKLKFSKFCFYTYCDGYFTKSNYFAITFLPPVVLVTILALLCFLLPKICVPSLYLALMLDVSGTSGDLYAAYIISRIDKKSLIKDTGETVFVYSKI